MTKADEFYQAIAAGDAPLAAALLDEEPALATLTHGGTSVLLLAIYHGRRDIAAIVASRRGELTLHEACALGDEEVAMRLVAADPGSVDRAGVDGHYPLGLAIFFGHPALARRLIEAGADITLHSKNPQNVAPLHAAAAICDRETLALLLDRGADVNARQERGYTALHTAAGRGDVETAKLLLARGADRDVRGTDGKSPADIARERGEENFAVWLTSH